LDKGATGDILVAFRLSDILFPAIPAGAAMDLIQTITCPMSPKLLNKRQVAQLFGVSKSTIERWLQDGKLPKPKRRFGWARWRYEELEPLLKSKTKI
jgi:excisionase family DNA binding protein